MSNKLIFLNGGAFYLRRRFSIVAFIFEKHKRLLYATKGVFDIETYEWNVSH